MSREPDDPVATLAEDPALGPVVRERGPVELTPAEDLYERLVVSLTRQQVSMAAAEAIEERLFDRFEVTPESMLAADPATLHDAGLSEAKAEYVRATAQAFQERGWDHDYFAGMDDDAVTAEVTDVRGVGPWTAKMFLMFGLAREDVFPVEDLGIRKGMATVFDAELGRGVNRG
ncbi:DNA-3-methyladenine glycosylase 2 family protein [Halobacteriales archaeon QH_8_68_33]|nr:MAG: DNA-3-methyladenine glycosylase 2 family protein [Halobacteriales archaeon QH_8_68_33]